MTRVLFLCLLAIATNAVLIQTVTTDNTMLKNGIRVAVLGIAAFAMIMRGSKMPIGIFLLITFSLILLVSRANTDQLSIIFVLILAVAMFDLRERTLNKMLMVLSVFSLLLVFALLAAGVTQNEVTEFRGRNTFGTNGVPFFYNLVYGAMTMLLVYVHKFQRRYRLLWTIAAVALSTHLFNLTDARGGYYAFLGFIVLLHMVPLLARVGIFRFLTATLPIGFIIVAFYIASLYEDAAANELLSIRPILFQRFIENLTLEDYLLSATVKQFDRAVTIVDNSYLHLLVGGGAVVFLVFMMIFGQAVLKLYRQGRFVDVAFVIATCVYFNSESILLRIENLFVIYFWYLILRHSRLVVMDSTVQRKSSVRIPPVPPLPVRTKARPTPAKPGRLPDWAGPGPRY